MLEEEKQSHEGILLTDDQQQYMLPHFLLMLIGKPGSGKTSVIKQMLNNECLYKDKFNHILLVSPSYAKMGFDDKIPQQNCNATFSLDWIFRKVEDINKEQLVQQKKVYSQFKGYEDEDHLDVSGRKTKSKLGTPANLAMQQQMLSDRLYSGKSRFFGANDKPGVILPGQSTTINYRRRMVATANGSARLGPNSAIATVAQSTSAQEAESKLQQINQKQLRELPQELRESFYTNVLLVLDDVVADIKKNETNPLLGKLIMNRRHIVHNGMVSIMLVSQKYTLIPARVRSNANWIISFKMNPLDSETIYKDVVHMPHDNWDQLLYFVFGSANENVTEKTTETENMKCDDENGEYTQKDTHIQSVVYLDKPKRDCTKGIQNLIKRKKHDNIGVWVEYDLYFKNFKLIQQ